MKDQMKYYGKEGIYFFSTDIYFSVKVKGQLVIQEEQILTLSAAGNVSSALWRWHLQAGQHWRSPERLEKTDGIMHLYRHPKEGTAPPETLGWGFTPSPALHKLPSLFRGATPKRSGHYPGLPDTFSWLWNPGGRIKAACVVLVQTWDVYSLFRVQDFSY